MRHLAVLASLAACHAAASLGCGGGGSCPAGAHENKDPAFCLTIPAGFQVAQAQGGPTKSIRISNPAHQGFTVYVEPPDDLDKRAAAIDGMAGGDLQLVAKGDVKNGKFFHYHTKSMDAEFAVVIVKGDKQFYRCEIQNTKLADAGPMLEACKTLSGP